MIEQGFRKFPEIAVENWEGKCWTGWNSILSELQRNIASKDFSKRRVVLCVDCYPGVRVNSFFAQFESWLTSAFNDNTVLIDVEAALLQQEEIKSLIKPYLTDDPVFGRMTYLNINEFFDSNKLNELKSKVDGCNNGLVAVIGTGATLVCKADITVYVDLARWEAQLRFRRRETGNIGFPPANASPSLQYKQAFFIDWRVADKHKKQIYKQWDYVVDANDSKNPKMITAQLYDRGLEAAVSRPFSFVPFFDPGPWGGQWMKEICGLDPEVDNYAWCFNCVHE